MNFSKEIIKTPVLLKHPTEHVESLEDGEAIATHLFEVLNDAGGIGLTANQIGINKSVFVINVKKPMYFINPVLLETGQNIVPFAESCLSIPKKVVTTARYTYVKLTADNLDGPIEFGNKIKTYTNFQSILEDEDLLECVAVQHEFDHTLGILITDRKIGIKPVHVDKTPNRNDKVEITKNGNSIFIKYKQFDKYKNDGWVLKNG